MLPVADASISVSTTAALRGRRASDEASFISGAEIAIDDGYIAAGGASLRNRVREDYTAGRVQDST